MKRCVQWRTMWNGLLKQLFREWKTDYRHWDVRMNRLFCCVRTTRTANWWWTLPCRSIRIFIRCISIMVNRWLHTNLVVPGRKFIRIWVRWVPFISVTYISWPIWNRSAGVLRISYKRRSLPCTMYTVPMRCTFIRRLHIGTGLIRLTNYRTMNVNSSWIVIGSGTRPGDAMRGTAIATVQMKWVTGIISWANSTEPLTKMQVISV